MTLQLNKRIKPIILSYLPFKKLIQFSLLSKEFSEIVLTLLGIEKDQLHFFLNYFFIFKELYSIDPRSAYCNQFFNYDINSIEIPNVMKETTKQIAIAYFINYVSYRRPKYYFYFAEQKDLEHHLAILQKLSNPQRFKYRLNSNRHKDADFFTLNNAKLLNYMQQFTTNQLSSLFFLCFKSMHEVTIPYINASFEEAIDQLITFSSEYPNKFKRYNLDGSIDKKKMNTFISLNTQSLTHLSKCEEFDLYPLCSNVKSMDLKNIPIPLNKIKVNFNQIEEIILDFNRANILGIIEFLNQMPHLHHFSFSNTTVLSDTDFIAVFSKLNTTELRAMMITLDNSYEIDLSFLFERFPQLHRIILDDNFTTTTSDSLCQGYISDAVKLPLQQYETLIRNWLKKDYHYLNLRFARFTASDFFSC